MLDDACVVPRGEPLGAGAAREREHRGEAEAPVAADAGVRRLAGGVAADERCDDSPPELVSEVERDVRQAERVACLAGCDHSLR